MTEFEVYLSPKPTQPDLEPHFKFSVFAGNINQAWAIAKQIKEDMYGAYYVKSVTHLVFTV